MQLTDADIEQLRDRLLRQKNELSRRVSRIHAHARDPLEADSEEQAAQLGNVAVVSALESEAVQEIAEIDAALQRIKAGAFGTCTSCGEPIGGPRLQARPAAAQCLDCAELD